MPLLRPEEEWVRQLMEVARERARGVVGVKRSLRRILEAEAPAVTDDDQPGDSQGRFGRAIRDWHLRRAEMAAREMGGLSLDDALSLCELLASLDPERYERAALRWLQRLIDERLPPLTEVVLAAAALAELRNGNRTVGLEALKRLLQHRWPDRFRGVRLYALVEAGDTEANDVYLCEQDAQRLLEDCLRDEPQWRGLLNVAAIELSAETSPN
jgi:hypothetical protein